MARLRFPYRPLPGKRDELLRPVLSVEILVPGILIPEPFAAIVDTGAPYTILPRSLGERFKVRYGTARRVRVAVLGWRVRAPLVEGLTLRLRGADVDAGGRETSVDVPIAALLVPPPMFDDFGLLGQMGFLDRVTEACVRERERTCEITVPEERTHEGAASVVRERPPRWRRRFRRRP